jgi:hypothetical protein
MRGRESESSRPFRCFKRVFELGCRVFGVDAMKCDECGVEEAAVHLTRVVEGRASERHLCLKCAAKETGSSGQEIAEVLRAWVEREAGKERKG